MTPPRPIRVLVVEDHHLARFGLRGVLEDEGDIQVVGEARNLAEARKLLGEVRPDVVVADIELPDGDGLELVAGLRDSPVRAVVVTHHEGVAHVARALSAGAHGFVRKDLDGAYFVAAVRAAKAGERFLPPAIAQELDETRGGPRLTDREREILELVWKGFGNKEIASVLGLTHGTVRIYMSDILRKLGAGSRTEAVRVALELGLLLR